MKQLGNLAIICAQRCDVLLQVLDGMAAVHVGHRTDKAALSAKWDDDERIGQIIHELNFGEFKKEKMEDAA